MTADPRAAGVSRRGLLVATGGALAATLTTDLGVVGAHTAQGRRATGAARAHVAFHGTHQAGIATPQQQHVVLAAYDLTTGDRRDLVALLRRWTTAAERLTAGVGVDGEPTDALGLGPARLTLTAGFGASLFDRIGARHLRPASLGDLPRFAGDALDPRWCGGDLVVQACADDPQVTLHAVRTLSRLGAGRSRPRWLQTGFLPTPTRAVPRNLFGFSDGTANINGKDAAALAEHVWVGGRDEPAWLHGGSYLVVRRIRMRLEQWDDSSLQEQEAAIGRARSDGRRFPDRPQSHAALARPEANDGVRILRRGYAFAAGLDQHARLDAGLLFLAWQRDPHAQFARIQRRLAQHDAMNEYVQHVGSALFVAPPGTQPGGWWGQALLTA